MYQHETQIRIHYALTDQMGVVYHGHYAQFYEQARAEFIRSLGYTYKDIEAMGVIMPVVDLHSKYLRPARYDDLITVRTQLRELPTHHKIQFHHEIMNDGGELLNTGTITLYFVDARTMKRIDIPTALREKLLPFFD
jgi:acyl-CoA thioester hydrolase